MTPAQPLLECLRYPRHDKPCLQNTKACIQPQHDHTQYPTFQWTLHRFSKLHKISRLHHVICSPAVDTRSCLHTTLYTTLHETYKSCTILQIIQIVSLLLLYQIPKRFEDSSRRCIQIHETCRMPHLCQHPKIDSRAAEAGGASTWCPQRLYTCLIAALPLLLLQDVGIKESPAPHCSRAWKCSAKNGSSIVS
jgi:hypothetical protein